LGGNNETKSEKGSCVMMWRLFINFSLIGHGFSYFNWGITTGYLKKPDPATIGILKMEYIISLIVIIVGGYIYHKKLKNVFR
jgi:hypothetical protein